MIPYNRDLIPPSPFTEVWVQHLVTRRRRMVPAKLDTGADISGIPNYLVGVLHLTVVRLISVEGFDGIPSAVRTYVVSMKLAGVTLPRVEVITLPYDYAILGRDVLNHFYIHLNGPDLTFDISPTPLNPCS